MVLKFQYSDVCNNYQRVNLETLGWHVLHNFLEENKLKPSLFSECCDTALLERKRRAVAMSPHGQFGAEWAPIRSGEGALRNIVQLDEEFSG